MRVWLNGQLQDIRKASVSPLDRGFLYGDGLFETLRSYRGKPFLLAGHLDRLAEGAKALELTMPPRPLLAEGVANVIEANGLAERDARVRITLTRGAGPGGLWPEEPGPPTALVTAQPLDLPGWLVEGAGARAVVSKQRVLSGAPRVKTTSFQPHVMAKAEAARAQCWEALLCNERGEVAEGATSNVFALLPSGALVTPPRDAGLLAGLTRDVVLRIAKPALCLDAAEAPLTLAELRTARELFLTSSVAEVVPLVRVDGQAVGDGALGPVARAVRDAYRAEVARICGNGNPMRNDSVK
jgi:branched-chain amino acid aminotransferase